MYKRILTSENLSIKDRLKRLLHYYRIRRGSRISWKSLFNRIFKVNPSYKRPIKASNERLHRLFWKPFSRNINLSTLRVCENISGISDHRFVPEEIFVADIEPTLNNIPSAELFAFKSLYNKWFPKSLFPKDYFHNIDGEWLDKDLKTISYKEVELITEGIHYPVVVKPNRNSYGGKNIHFPQGQNELLKLCQRRKDFLVQEFIYQHEFLERFNNKGINTIRVNIYRSVIDNKLKILNAALRFGVGGSLDNLTAGGIVTTVNQSGFLNGYAVDKYGQKYLSHPDSKLKFNTQIPNYDKIKVVCLNISEMIKYVRLIALDLCIDRTGKWRMIEVNIFGGTILFSQYHGIPFFGDYTEEVRDYCLTNHWSLI